MKLSWILTLLLLLLVATFSVQNADAITVRWLSWEITLSAALAIQLAAMLGAVVGLAVGVRARREPSAVIAEEAAKPETTEPSESPPEPSSQPVRLPVHAILPP